MQKEISLGVNDWSRVIFSDECRIELHPQTREYVRRRVGTNKFNEKYINQTRKFSASLMLWGAIRSDGRRVLLRCNKNVDQWYYQSLLNQGLPSIYTTRYFFQHDGASSHTARTTTEYLTEKTIRVLPEWPSQSPDISIIENLWNILKVNVKKRNAQTIEQLWSFCEEEWNAIPNDVISRLFESLPHRILSIISAKGGNSKY